MGHIKDALLVSFFKPDACTSYPLTLRASSVFLSIEVAAASKGEVSALGQEVISDQIFRWISDAERNKPYVKGSGRNAFGRWTGDLVTSEGWKQLQRFGIAKGMVATGYDETSPSYGPYARALQFLRLHLWEPSCANVTCPSAMQDGAARLVQLHITDPARLSRLTPDQRRVFENAFRHLTSRDPSFAWTSGQWMTERTGGSDVSRTETTAMRKATDEYDEFVAEDGVLPLGPWRVNGFKWFSSATDSDMTVLLARTPAGGLSSFLAPLRRRTRAASDSRPELNGVRIQRLKDKVGTAPLPTAEVVLEDTRAWMIGKEGQGIHEISTMLSITRVHSAIAAVGYVGRGLDIARAFSLVREIGTGKGGRISLAESPLHLKTLAGMTVEYRGLMLLATFTAYILGLSEHLDKVDSLQQSPALKALTPRRGHITALLRVLSQITKGYVCKTSVSLLFSCMECVGGVGYLNNAEQEELNVSRLWRDCAVLPIWEGTTDVLSTDFIRALKHPTGGSESLDALEELIRAASEFTGSRTSNKTFAGWDPVQRWELIRTRVVSETQAELMGDARGILWQVAEILIAVLLHVDARRDSNAVARDIFEEFVGGRFFLPSDRERVSARAKTERDSAIVFDGRQSPKPDSKL